MTMELCNHAYNISAEGKGANQICQWFVVSGQTHIIIIVTILIQMTSEAP